MPNSISVNFGLLKLNAWGMWYRLRVYPWTSNKVEAVMSWESVNHFLYRPKLVNLANCVYKVMTLPPKDYYLILDNDAKNLLTDFDENICLSFL